MCAKHDNLVEAGASGAKSQHDAQNTLNHVESMIGQ